jgi:hypothetical protein
MRVSNRLRRWALLVPLLALWTGNCQGRFERNLDYVLSPGAYDNAILTPSTGLAGLAQFFANTFLR